MSGTSVDGVDVAIAAIRGSRVTTLASHSSPFPRRVREEILKASNATVHVADLSRLHFLLGELYADALEQLLGSSSGVPRPELIGCHGQTIYHQAVPARFLGRRVAATLQIGEPSLLAERFGVPVVSDFRPRDLVAGGQAAPLVPFVDFLLFRHGSRGRAALNIGGIANVTWIPPAARPGDVLAFDTGPGNMVMDALVQVLTNGRLRFDSGGRLAAKARADLALLARLEQDPFYKRRPPKSAGREQYGREFVRALLATGLPVPVLLATATELTAATIAHSILTFGVASRVDDLIVSGGGVHNATLMSAIQRRLPSTKVSSSREYGMDPDAKEAVAFAVLAHRTFLRRPANLPAATGARHPVILGKLTR